ncbi:MAG: TetR family transcriptional regulator [Microbacterium sp.]
MGDADRPRGKAAIVEAALRILDEYGLADLTMRRLAAELEVQPSALYWHFESKQALLAAVADRIVDAMRPADDVANWRDATAAAARAMRDALLAHRDGAEVVLSTFALGLGSQAGRRRLAEALGPDRDAHAADALLQFVLGHASLVQQRIQATSLGVAVHSADERTATATFELGVALLLRGLDRS